MFGTVETSNKSGRSNADVDVNASIEICTNDADRVFAKEIGRMSTIDRNAVFEEIHGVSTMAIEENPDLLEKSLAQLQHELEQMDPASRFAYDIVANQDGDNTKKSESGRPAKQILSDRKFLLRFLRCTLFDASKAATRLVVFFEVVRLLLYGNEELKNFEPTMDFFIKGKEDQVALKLGYLQLLPFCDRSGRKVLIFGMDAMALPPKT
eukprot:CAMPEP_0201212110 /NCGR_PEP_ID=MMETSP0851-20130426/183522_1 /ASSEMBLY_ACC=CAM_ASM_000631 /TAXON_ID=183588 /ORGANISM="Pseudo-nitzschia fraudulenta, Strain WWA7" /LENGTH=208 /DNA_ID=CAMNT_0047501127 /DNA_START=486 /DNA_END=1109 /DNA_ORIENTATION=+